MEGGSGQVIRNLLLRKILGEQHESAILTSNCGNYKVFGEMWICLWSSCSAESGDSYVSWCTSYAHQENHGIWLSLNCWYSITCLWSESAKLCFWSIKVDKVLINCGGNSCWSAEKIDILFVPNQIHGYHATSIERFFRVFANQNRFLNNMYILSSPFRQIFQWNESTWATIRLS